MMADALASAHAAGVIHRDVKPSNIILVGSARENPLDAPFVAKLVDFGVAAAEDAKLTRTGAIVGTPAYMAPEQARGDGEVRTTVDLYALGATLFEMIAGRPPHIGPTPIAILARLVTTAAPRLSDVVVDAPPRSTISWPPSSPPPPRSAPGTRAPWRASSARSRSSSSRAPAGSARERLRHPPVERELGAVGSSAGRSRCGPGARGS